jgi:alpha/beta superfamily hydrolase
VSEIIITGPAGRIECRYHQNPNPKAPVALVLHPHPLYGGTMNNKITYSLYKTFAENGFSVLRMNFRGVGKSQGKFDNGAGELLDATVVLNWLHDRNMQATQFWVAGFSFGAWLALQLVIRRPEIENYILVAPPATKYDFSFIVPFFSTGLVVQGDADDISKETDTAKLVDRLVTQESVEVDYSVVPGADHFFKDKMPKLVSIADAHIKLRLELDSSKVKKIKRDRRRRKKKSGADAKPERNYFPVRPLSYFEN